MKQRKVRKITRKNPNRRLSKSRKRTNRPRKTKRRKTTKQHSRKKTRNAKKIKTKPKYSKYSGFYRGGTDGYGTLHYKVYKTFQDLLENQVDLSKGTSDPDVYQVFYEDLNTMKKIILSIKTKINSVLDRKPKPTPTPTPLTLKELIVIGDSNPLKTTGAINEMDFIFRLLFEPDYHQLLLDMKYKSTGYKSNEKHTIILEIKNNDIDSIVIEAEEEHYFNKLKRLKELKHDNSIETNKSSFIATYNQLLSKYNELRENLDASKLKYEKQLDKLQKILNTIKTNLQLTVDIHKLKTILDQRRLQNIIAYTRLIQDLSMKLQDKQRELRKLTLEEQKCIDTYGDCGRFDEKKTRVMSDIDTIEYKWTQKTQLLGKIRQFIENIKISSKQTQTLFSILQDPNKHDMLEGLFKEYDESKNTNDAMKRNYNFHLIAFESLKNKKINILFP